MRVALLPGVDSSSRGPPPTPPQGLLLADNPTAADPRAAEDARGRRPHQIAYANRSYRLAVVLRPDYPPRYVPRGSAPVQPRGGGPECEGLSYRQPPPRRLLVASSAVFSLNDDRL